MTVVTAPCRTPCTRISTPRNENFSIGTTGSMPLISRRRARQAGVQLGSVHRVDRQARCRASVWHPCTSPGSQTHQPRRRHEELKLRRHTRLLGPTTSSGDRTLPPLSLSDRAGELRSRPGRVASTHTSAKSRSRPESEWDEPTGHCPRTFPHGPRNIPLVGWATADIQPSSRAF